MSDKKEYSIDTEIILDKIFEDTFSCEELQDDSVVEFKQYVEMIGRIEDIEIIPLSSGNGKMARLQLGDKTGQIETMVFSKIYPKCKRFLEEGNLVKVCGKIYRNKKENRMISCQFLTDTSI